MSSKAYPVPGAFGYGRLNLRIPRSPCNLNTGEVAKDKMTLIPRLGTGRESQNPRQTVFRLNPLIGHGISDWAGDTETSHIQTIQNIKLPGILNGLQAARHP